MLDITKLESGDVLIHKNNKGKDIAFGMVNRVGERQVTFHFYYGIKTKHLLTETAISNRVIKTSFIATQLTFNNLLLVELKSIYKNTYIYKIELSAFPTIFVTDNTGLKVNACKKINNNNSKLISENELHALFIKEGKVKREKDRKVGQKVLKEANLKLHETLKNLPSRGRWVSIKGTSYIVKLGSYIDYITSPTAIYYRYQAVAIYCNSRDAFIDDHTETPHIITDDHKLISIGDVNHFFKTKAEDRYKEKEGENIRHIPVIRVKHTPTSCYVMVESTIDKDVTLVLDSKKMKEWKPKDEVKWIDLKKESEEEYNWNIMSKSVRKKEIPLKEKTHNALRDMSIIDRWVVDASIDAILKLGMFTGTNGLDARGYQVKAYYCTSSQCFKDYYHDMYYITDKTAIMDKELVINYFKTKAKRRYTGKFININALCMPFTVNLDTITEELKEDGIELKAMTSLTNNIKVTLLCSKKKREWLKSMEGGPLGDKVFKHLEHNTEQRRLLRNTVGVNHEIIDVALPKLEPLSPKITLSTDVAFEKSTNDISNNPFPRDAIIARKMMLTDTSASNHRKNKIPYPVTEPFPELEPLFPKTILSLDDDDDIELLSATKRKQVKNLPLDED